MERLLKDLHKHDNYSEIMIYGPSGYSIGRLFLDPFSRVLYSSKGSDFTEVNKLQERGMSLEMAIEEVAKQINVET